MRRSLLIVTIVAGLSGLNLMASPILSGSFNIAGTVQVFENLIDWTGNSAPFVAQQAVIGPGATGSFASLSGTTVTIRDLNRITEPVGTTFGPDLFITFDAAPSLPALNINFIFAGIYSSAGCKASPAKVGQNCTPGPPVTPGPSPFNFVNNNPPAHPEATATWVFSGIAANGASSWDGNFTSQFSVPFQTVLASFGPTGSVTNTYSATITATPIPESSSWALAGLGVLVMGCSRFLLIRQKRRS